MNNVITIERFNKLTGQETLHPLVGLADLSGDKLHDDLRLPCNFYALICRPDENGNRASLRLVNPGEMFEIPAAFHCNTKGYTGVIFHPDLLCDTPLEQHIDDYPTRCSCHGALTEREHAAHTPVPTFLFLSLSSHRNSWTRDAIGRHTMPQWEFPSV